MEMGTAGVHQASEQPSIAISQQSHLVSLAGRRSAASQQWPPYSTEIFPSAGSARCRPSDRGKRR